MSERPNIVDHNQLFRQDKYVRQREEKRAFEAPCSPEEVTDTLEYTKTKEYKDKNFARTAVVVNPAKACQPLGAVMAALGFEKRSRSFMAHRAVRLIFAVILPATSKSLFLPSPPR